MTRAATIPDDALEAGDLMGETPKGKKARDVVYAEQTSDQKAEEIVKKVLTRILKRRCPRTWRGLRPRSSNPPLDWCVPERDTKALCNKFNKFEEGTCHLESNLFRFRCQRNLTTKLERSNAERWYLILKPRGKTWKTSPYCKFKETSLTIDASMAYDQIKELEKILDYESFMKECLACESVCKTEISPLEIPGSPQELSDSAEQTALTRTKATLLMKAMLESVANEQEAQKNAER